MPEGGKVVRVDFHTHIFPQKLPALGTRYGDDRWPRLEPDGDSAVQIMVGSSAYRKIGSQAWVHSRRLEDMDREGVDIQVISPTPITFGYWGKAEACLELSRFQNDFIARMVSESPRRFIGLGTVPMQDPKAAIGEMTRVRRELKLAGVEIGASIDGKGFHVPELRDFFKAAVELSCPLFVHPTNEPWSVPEQHKRAALPGLYQTVGMPGETNFAAATLILGGVMNEIPGLRVCLAHGGGPLCWTVPRMDHFWAHTTVAQSRLKVGPLEAVRSFWADTLTYDVDNLILLKARLGAEKLMVGTDYPFDAREIPPGAVLDRAHEAGSIAADEIAGMRGANALRFLNLPDFVRSL
jgi:aminocarboxymuconate-semialdehyde decarboxylase